VFFIHVPCFLMCIHFYFSFNWLQVGDGHCFAIPWGTGERLAEGATKGTTYARTTFLLTRITSSKHVSLLSTVHSFGPFSTILVGRISLVATYAKGQRQQHVRFLSYVRVLFTCLCVPWPHMCVCLPVRLSRYRVPASACGTCAGPLCACALYLFARAFPVPACVLCLPLGGHTHLRWVSQPHG